MTPKDNNAEFLEKYRPVIVGKLRVYKEKRGELSELAKQLGFDQARLSEIMRGSRKITEYYIRRMILGKVITVDEIVASAQDLTVEEERFWQEMRILQDTELINLLLKLDQTGLMERGKAIIKALLPNNNK